MRWGHLDFDSLTLHSSPRQSWTAAIDFGRRRPRPSGRGILAKERKEHDPTSAGSLLSQYLLGESENFVKSKGFVNSSISPKQFGLRQEI